MDHRALVGSLVILAGVAVLLSLAYGFDRLTGALAGLVVLLVVAGRVIARDDGAT